MGRQILRTFLKTSPPNTRKDICFIIIMVIARFIYYDVTAISVCKSKIAAMISCELNNEYNLHLTNLKVLVNILNEKDVFVLFELN